jgi:Uncharacterised nucleotidyltransferase
MMDNGALNLLNREERFLLLCCSGAGNEKLISKVDALVSSGLDWLRVRSRMSQYPFLNVAALTYPALASIRSRFDVPSNIIGYAESFYQLNKSENEVCITELVRVIRKLRQHDIDCVVVKGPALVLTLYPDTGMRQFSDLDLLFLPDQIWAAGQCLQELGYAFTDPGARRQLGFLQNHHHLPPLVKNRDDTRQFVIEVQWAVSGYCKNSSFARRLRDRARTVTVDGTEIRVPCLEDLFLHALLDTLAHEFEKGIKSLCDLNYMYRTCGLRLRWEHILDEIAALGIRNEAELVLVLLNRLLGCSVDASVNTVVSDIPDCIIMSAEERLLHRRSESILFWKLLASSGWRQRFDFLRDGLKNSGETTNNAARLRQSFILRSIRQFIRVIKSIRSASDIIQNERAQMVITGWIDKQKASRDPAT